MYRKHIILYTKRKGEFLMVFSHRRIDVSDIWKIFEEQISKDTCVYRKLLPIYMYIVQSPYKLNQVFGAWVHALKVLMIKAYY